MGTSLKKKETPPGRRAVLIGVGLVERPPARQGRPTISSGVCSRQRVASAASRLYKLAPLGDLRVNPVVCGHTEAHPAADRIPIRLIGGGDHRIERKPELVR